MSKKVLSVLLLLTLVLGSVSTAFATEADLTIPDSVVVEDQIVSDEPEAIVEDQIVNDDAIVEEDTADQEVVQGVNMADIEEAISTGNFAITPRAVGYVMDFAGLKKAVEDPTVNIVVVMNDIQMEETLTVNRDITFLAPAGATLFSSPDRRHFWIGWGVPSVIKIEFSQIILDGKGVSGGIEIENSSHIKGVTIQNCRGYGMGGGALYVGKPTSFVLENSILTNSTAQDGGGIYIYGCERASIINCDISNNTAATEYDYIDTYGGGMRVDYGCTLEIIDTKIDSNTATFGGGISARLENLTATEDVIFSNNKAAEGYFMTDPADIALHNQNILTTSFTEPFTYGYNNFDIGYTKGDKLAAVTVNYFIKVSDTTPLASVATYAGQTIGAITAPADPTMDNLVFIGWADEDNVFYDADSVITDDLNLYAVWKLK